jgi:hypothetical protein
MTAPVATNRTTPSGKFFKDGYRTLITFAANASIQLWEKSVKPPGLDGGEAIDVTTMHNIEWRTKAFQTLKELTESTMTVGYKGTAYAQVKALINVETTVTITFPNGSKIAFFGGLRSFEAGDQSIGEMPEGTVTITPTMRDLTTGIEESFVYTAASGTGT